ncbi:MAG: hypothetical protein EBY09_10780 [Verrucomicrobia bacterium]|nr:hypothetical protein [Pseudomonadota bacterium]NDA67107.1 hypothetical protein [Verrucomicrobiota bacterium]NDD38813.1 hypothetical protein [Verrucomicrobiota bacterium]NDE98471.1 hypothetical protein [Verrucomicrobiota bacterium]
MDVMVSTESPSCPKCGSDRVDYEKFGRPWGKKAVCFITFAVCYLAASVIAIAVETNTLPADSPAWLKAVAHYLEASELGRLIIVGAVIMVVIAYMLLEGMVDAVGTVAKWLGSHERRCRLCGHRWPVT